MFFLNILAACWREMHVVTKSQELQTGSFFLCHSHMDDTVERRAVFSHYANGQTHREAEPQRYVRFARQQMDDV